MSDKRQIEIFSAGCGVCTDAVDKVRGMICPSCEVTVLDMKDAAVAERAKSLDIQSVPAVVIDGALADCCSGRGINEETLRAAGVGRPL
ncbi:MAG: thioredoxin family protein [Rhodospirillales bacterium]|nr:thioredoxin family protein [Alphaproteobacteria bacterium]MBL6948287.1 thioredoxin family protein [Rhodospirillales bacterium]